MTGLYRQVTKQKVSIQSVARILVDVYLNYSADKTVMACGWCVSFSPADHVYNTHTSCSFSRGNRCLNINVVVTGMEGRNQEEDIFHGGQ